MHLDTVFTMVDHGKFTVHNNIKDEFRCFVLESDQHPGALKDAVCSPGGSTIQGVRTLEQRGFRGAVMDAVIAAYEKNKEMGKN